MTAEDIRQALKNRYKQPEWALFFEVANGTGANCKRHADALAMNMYPSRGLTIVGFEIKISRNDLKKELDNPDKAEEIAQFCDEWWLVVPEGLIKTDDLIPVKWGVLECKGDKVRIKKRADSLLPQQVTRQFVAAILRSAVKVDDEALAIAREEAYQQYRREFETELESRVKIETRRLQDVVNKIHEFEKLTGEKFKGYVDAEELAERWQLAKNIQSLYGKYGTLQRVATAAERFLEEFKSVAAVNKS